MKTTIITITLNAAARLQRCIDSILQQSRLPDEYIFVDGGSTDNTLPLLEQAITALEQRGVACTLLHQQHVEGNAGIPEAWNQGIQQATGDIIALLNSDDYYTPDTLQTIYTAFEQHPEAELVTSPIDMTDATGNTLYSLYPSCLCLCEIKMPVPHPGTFIRNTLYQKIGLYNTKYKISADYDFIWRCRQAKAQIHYLKDVLVKMEAGGLANSSRAKARKETLDIALSHSHLKPIPYLAYFLRKLTGK